MKKVKHIPVSVFVPAVPEPVAIHHCLRPGKQNIHDHEFRSLGSFAPATEGGHVICHELVEHMQEQPSYKYFIEQALGQSLSGCAQTQHLTLIDSLQATWALPQVMHMHANHHAELFNQNRIDEEYPLNLFPVHCQNRLIICMATIQYDPGSNKFDVFNHEFTSPEEIPLGSRLFLRQPRIG